ncbi:hypothetical protein BX666DRAFT_411806 [Dichotomocladium elegans]|nr:hypothetical protein BX666DRAFT_411806 [Dichotomocladium elegans]
MITDRIAVCAGQSGGLIALWDNPADKSFEERLITLFSFQYSDIILRPVLASLLPSAILDVVLQAQPIAGHILPWARNIASDAAKPIMGVTVSGCVVRVHKISQPLYHLLIALQERILIYSSALFIPLGSARDFRWFSNLSQKEKHVVHGDLLVLFLRLLPEQQREIVEMNEPEQPSIVKATRTFLETSARDTFALDHRELAEEKDDKTILWEYASKIAAMLVQVLGALERCC